MIVINQAYLDKFSKYNREYLYQIDKGLYLAFDIEDLSYIGIEMFYLAPMKYVHKKENECLKNLLSKNILELKEQE